MTEAAGRVCPLRYRYGPAALRGGPTEAVETLYTVGGLYGNGMALAAVLWLAAAEPGPVRLCFNGDFHWFDVDEAGFAAIDRAVAMHDALQGNVEAELAGEDDAAGCGCAYPTAVEEAVVARSNLIHARLRATAARHPALRARLAALPMWRRYRVGGARVGVVHGDAESLAGWRFDAAALDDAANRAWIVGAADAAGVDVFAGSHTCLPALRTIGSGPQTVVVANNGAAGMPNFRGERAGLITRIGIAPSPHSPVYGTVAHGVHVDALAVAYDDEAWRRDFLAQWPPASPAHASYWRRLVDGPDYTREQAAPPL